LEQNRIPNLEGLVFLPWITGRSRLFQTFMARLNGIAVRTASRAPMVEFLTTKVTVDAGVEGDCRGQPGPRQVTVLSADAWVDACEALKVDLAWTTRRANLLIEGIRFGPDSVGRILKVGDLQLEITSETDPCNRMTKACPGLREALTPDWCGGVCCRVLSGGRIAVGDPVGLLSPKSKYRT
jgi:MOSC domain-containing protein YiiM